MFEAIAVKTLEIAVQLIDQGADVECKDKVLKRVFAVQMSVHELTNEPLVRLFACRGERALWN